MSIRDFKNDIHKDTNVLGANVYIGNGQGCGTIWFDTIKQAQKFIDKYRWISGHDSGLCEKCSHHYSFGTDEYKKYPAFACKKWKEKIVKEALK